MNVVPSQRVRRLAEEMVKDAEEMPGADVVIKYGRHIRRSDVPALLALLLTSTKAHKKLGRPALPAVLPEAERRRQYAFYKKGDRSPEAVHAFREYQRIQQRRQRERTAGAA